MTTESKLLIQAPGQVNLEEKVKPYEILNLAEFKKKYSEVKEKMLEEYRKGQCHRWGLWLEYASDDDYVAISNEAGKPGRISGAITWHVIDSKQTLISIDLLCVNPGYERQGIGGSLVKTVIDGLPATARYVILEPTAMSRPRLCVDPSEKGLYQKLGFKSVPVGFDIKFPEWEEANEKYLDENATAEERKAAGIINRRFSLISDAFNSGLLLDLLELPKINESLTLSTKNATLVVSPLS